MPSDLKILQTNSFEGGQNTDLAPDLLPSNKYAYMLNCNVLSSAEGNVGIVTNLKGNIKIEVDLPEGENKTIGVGLDEEKNKFYYAVWNSNGMHGWYMFDAVSMSITPVLISMRDTGSVDIFQWKKDNLILHVNIIDNNKLYWAVKDSPARKFNIAKALDKSVEAGYGDVIFEEYTRAYKKPPMLAPSVRYITDLTKKFNRVYGSLFKFAARFIYDDGEESNWSDFSKVAVPYEESFTGVKGVPLDNNGIVVTVLTGSNIVVKIEIGMQRTNPDRENAEGVGMEWVSVVTLDKQTLGISSNGQYEYQFFNDSAYIILDPEKIIRPYSFLPKNPECQEFTKNALLYSTFYEGFPVVKIDMSATVRYDELYLPSGSSTGLNNPSVIFNLIDNYYESGGFASKGWRHTVGEIIIGPDVKAGNIFRVNFSDGSTTVNYNVEATLSDSSTTIANRLAVLFRSNNKMRDGGGYVTEVVNSRFTFDIWNNAGRPYWNVYPSVNRVDTVILEDNGQSLNNIKLGSSNGYGIMYEDEDGRKSLVYSNNTIIPISTVNELGGIKRPVVSLEIKNPAPEWATYYQVVRTGDLVYDDYIQLLIQKIVVNTDSSGNEFYDLVVGSLYAYQKIYPNTTIGFPFEKGDRVRLVSEYNGTAWTIPSDIKEYEVIEYKDVTTTVVNQDVEVDGTIIVKVDDPSADNIGSFIVIDGNEREIIDIDAAGYKLSAVIATGDGEATRKYPSFEIINRRGVIRIKIDPAYPIVVDPADDKFALVEIYKPSITKAVLSDENYYSFGYKFPIIRDGDNYYHTGNIQDQTISQGAIVEVAEGNNYVRNRALPTNMDSKNPQYLVTSVEDPGYSDFYVSDLSSNGRVNVLDRGMGEIFFDSRVRWSNNYIEGTSINGLSDFDNLDRQDYNDKYGSIKRLLFDEGRLYVFKFLKYAWIPVYGNIIQDQEGNDLIAQSTKIIPPSLQYFLWEGGVGDNPESITRNGNNVFSVSPNSGAVCRLGGNGVLPISKIFGLDEEVSTIISRASLSSAKMIGGFDRRNGNYVLSIEGYDNIIFNQLFANGDWSVDSVIIPPNPIWVIVDQPSHGSVSISGSSIIYSPDTDYVGQDNFTYSLFEDTLIRHVCIDVINSGNPKGWRAINPYCITD